MDSTEPPTYCKLCRLKHGGGIKTNSPWVVFGAIISLCVAGWQLRPWARLCSHCPRGDNAAGEALRDIPDLPEAILWQAATVA